MRTIDNIRDDIINNRYNQYKNKILNVNEKFKNINIPSDQIEQLAANAQKMSYVSMLINYSVNDKCINEKGFLKKLTDEINFTTKFNLSSLDVYKLMKKSIEQKKEQKMLLKKNTDPNNVIEMQGGFISEYFGWYDETGTFTKVLDVLSLILDLAGAIPKIGIFIDAINIIINLLRQEWVMAGLTLISIIPIIGTIGPVLKIVYQIIRDKNPENEEDLEDECSCEEYEDEEYVDDEDVQANVQANDQNVQTENQDIQVEDQDVQFYGIKYEK